MLKYHDFNTKDCFLCSKSFNIFYYCDYYNIYFCKQKLDKFKKINKKIHPGKEKTLFPNVLKEEYIGCKNNYNPRFYCTFC